MRFRYRFGKGQKKGALSIVNVDLEVASECDDSGQQLDDWPVRRILRHDAEFMSALQPVTMITLRNATGVLDWTMNFARVMQGTLRMLDRLTVRLAPEPQAEHLRTGQRGEEDAYFFLRKRGYVMVARNFRSAKRKGEIDLIGWDRDVLAFIEVKTRSTREVKPAETAVDFHKKRELAAVAHEYLRHMPPSCQWRFDVVSVYYDQPPCQPQFELFQNAFHVS